MGGEWEENGRRMGGEWEENGRRMGGEWEEQSRRMVWNRPEAGEEQRLDQSPSRRASRRRAGLRPAERDGALESSEIV